MNSLVVLEEEICERREHCSMARLVGDRARYAFEQHELKKGIEVRASVFGWSRGKAFVVSADKGEVVLELRSQSPERPKSLPVHLIVALPRPQTVKKVLELAASFGVESLSFIRSQSVVKSYFDSPVLGEGERQKNLVKGLEQVYDFQPPKTTVHKRFRLFMEESLPGVLANVPAHARLLAHTVGGELLQELDVPPMDGASFALALGPESGWNEHEVNQFCEAGFRVWTFGERMFRVEHALGLALGQLMSFHQ